MRLLGIGEEAGIVTWLERSPGGDHGGQDREGGERCIAGGFEGPGYEGHERVTGKQCSQGCACSAVVLGTLSRPTTSHTCMR